MTKVTLVNGAEYELTAPKGKHLRVLADIIQKGDNEMLSAFKLVSVLSTPVITVDEIDELDGEDVMRLLEAVKAFRLNGTSK